MKNLKSNIFFKIGMIIVIILILLIPTALIQQLIKEREFIQEDAISEVSEKWGRGQTITGPFISIPYEKHIKKALTDSTSKIVIVKEWAHFLPENLKINGLIQSDKMKRGNYEIVVYETALDISGSFNEFDFKKLGVDPDDVYFDKAILNMGISDLKGIENQVELDWNKDKVLFNSGVGSSDVLSVGINADVNVAKEGLLKSEFNLKLNLKGSQYLYFTPMGKTTDIFIKSDWTTPSFTGEYLPDDRETDKNGFEAKWNVLNLNRNYPQSWVNDQYQVEGTTFGTDLLLPVDDYKKSYRVARYSILFIVLTFMVFFFVEVMNKVFIHPIQYLLVGISLVVFYTLLLSFSEHMLFNSAYLLAAGLTLTLITGYTMAILKSFKLSVLVSGVLLILYIFIFTIMQLEDYALLIGSVGMFLILAIVMFFSRKIDWYNIKIGKDEKMELIEEN